MSKARWQITHRTAYTYVTPARDSFNEVRLKPMTNAHQTVESFVLTTSPQATLRQYNDFYSNCVHHFELSASHSNLVIESRTLVAAHPPAPLPRETITAPLAELPHLPKGSDCFDHLGASRFVDLDPETWRLAVDATMGITDAWQAAQALMFFLRGHVEYLSASTHVHTHLREVLAQRKGVCQDFAHVMIGLCRTLKLPARYVSGYLAVEKASATHAWVEVWIPTIGWLGLDPTHNQQVDHTYIKIGAGRDYSDVPPVTGHYKGSLQRRMEVEVNIEAVS